MSKKNKISLRFGICSENEVVSGTYKIWTEKNEVYLLERVAGKFFKVSLHKSGNWQVSFTSEFLRDKTPIRGTRHMDQWKYPKDNIARGMTLAFRIKIPESELRKSKSATTTKITCLNPPKKDHFLEVDLIFTEENAKFIDWPGKYSMNTSLLKQIKLPNTNTLWIVYHYHPMYKELISLLNEHKILDKNRIKRMDFDFDKPEGVPKGILGADELDGSKSFIEMSLL